MKKVDSDGEFAFSFQYSQLNIWTEAQVVAAQNYALPVGAVQNRTYGLSVLLNCRGFVQ